MSAVAQDKPHTVYLTPDLELAIRRRLEPGAYDSDLNVIREFGLRRNDCRREGYGV